MSFLRNGIALVVACMLVCAPQFARADDSKITPEQVMAAMISKFIPYIEWAPARTSISDNP